MTNKEHRQLKELLNKQRHDEEETHFINAKTQYIKRESKTKDIKEYGQRTIKEKIV